MNQIKNTFHRFAIDFSKSKSTMFLTPHIKEFSGQMSAQTQNFSLTKDPEKSGQIRIKMPDRQAKKFQTNQVHQNLNKSDLGQATGQIIKEHIVRKNKKTDLRVDFSSGSSKSRSDQASNVFHKKAMKTIAKNAQIQARNMQAQKNGLIIQSDSLRQSSRKLVGNKSITDRKLPMETPATNANNYQTQNHQTSPYKMENHLSYRNANHSAMLRTDPSNQQKYT